MRTVKEKQLGFYFSTPIATNPDMEHPEDYYNRMDELSSRFNEECKKSPFWNKKYVEHGTSYDHSPYEVCEQGFESESHNGKECFSVWLVIENSQIPDEDRAGFISIFKKVLSLVSQKHSLDWNFIGVKTYTVWHDSEFSDLEPN